MQTNLNEKNLEILSVKSKYDNIEAAFKDIKEHNDAFEERIVDITQHNDTYCSIRQIDQGYRNSNI